MTPLVPSHGATAKTLACEVAQKLVKLVLPVENLMFRPQNRYRGFVRESGRRLHETIVRLLAVVSPQLRNHCQQGTHHMLLYIFKLHAGGRSISIIHYGV
jgi:hypothetical protein